MSPNSLQTMQQAWNRYVQDNVLDSRNVRPHVASSWERCLSLKVDPKSEDQLDISERELEERLSKRQALVNLAIPAMKNIYNFVKGSGFQVVLADEQGVLLKVMGDSEIIRKTQGIQLCPGAKWTESLKGTNAIGTCLIEKRPLQVHAWEHFCQANHFITCSAAPIFSPDSELLGVLDLTGDYRYANAHTLGMVVAGANAIENQLRLHKTNTKLFSAYKYSNTIIKTMTDGVLTVDNRGMVTQLNSAGAVILGTDPREAIGQHVSKILSKAAPILNLLSSGQSYEDQEVVIEGNGKTFYSSASLLHDDYGNKIGAVAVLKKPQTNKKNPRRVLIPLPARYSFDDIIGNSELMKATKKMAQVASQSPSTVLLTGESGTGKELFAQSIHNASPRRDGAFVAINCAAIPENLIESELFGHEEGSFTGARKGGQPGKVEIADGGTLFLDEIGDMPLYTQVKLLRLIQERKVSRVGSTMEVPVDIRIIAATHKNLKKEVEENRFRRDLFYRLNVLSIKIPSLCERQEDIPLMIQHLVQKLAQKLGKQGIVAIPAFTKKCMTYPWPGNCRELENLIERAINLCPDNGELTPELIEFDGIPNEEPDIIDGPIRPLRDMERDMIVKALEQVKGNIVQASSMLGISRNTIYRKIKEFDIEI